MANAAGKNPVFLFFQDHLSKFSCGRGRSIYSSGFALANIFMPKGSIRKKMGIKKITKIRIGET
jgi:hypothetical protein